MDEVAANFSVPLPPPTADGGDDIDFNSVYMEELRERISGVIKHQKTYLDALEPVPVPSTSEERPPPVVASPPRTSTQRLPTEPVEQPTLSPIGQPATLKNAKSKPLGGKFEKVVSSLKSTLKMGKRKRTAAEVRISINFSNNLPSGRHL